jgi:hypothetical protein
LTHDMELMLTLADSNIILTPQFVLRKT